MSLFKTALLIIILNSTFPLLQAENKLLTYSFGSGDWNPIIYSDENSSIGYSGLYVEILDEIFKKKLNIDIVYIANPWKRAQQLVENGKADFLITVATKDRLKYTYKSQYPVFKLHLGLYTYAGHPKLNDIQNIKNVEHIKHYKLLPVSNLGNGWHKENIDAFNINTLYVKEDINIIKFLASMRADIMIDTIIPMNYKIKELNLTSNIILTDARFGSIEFHLLFSKLTTSTDLIKEINIVINELIKDGTLSNLSAKYSMLD